MKRTIPGARLLSPWAAICAGRSIADTDPKALRISSFAGLSNMEGADLKVKNIQRFPLFAGLDSYAREHWTHEGENPPVGIILCSAADEALARYTLDTLPNKVMAGENQLALPAVKKLEAELAATRKRLERAGKFKCAQQ